MTPSSSTVAARGLAVVLLAGFLSGCVTSQSGREYRYVGPITDSPQQQYLDRELRPGERDNKPPISRSAALEVSEPIAPKRP